MSSPHWIKHPSIKTREVYQTTYRCDFKPLNERPVQLHRWTPRPRTQRPAPSTAPKIDGKTRAKITNYHYRTTNSCYGTSTFAQKGKSSVVSLLEGDYDSQAGGEQQKALPALEASVLDCAVAATHSPLEVSASSSRQGLYSASPASSLRSPAPRPPTPPGPARREAWPQKVPVTMETEPGADRKLPHIGGGGEGSDLERLKEQKVGVWAEGDVGKYNAYLRGLCQSSRMESLLRKRAPGQTSIQNRATSSEETTTTYQQSFSPPGRKRRGFTVTEQKWQPWTTEYTDRFCEPGPKSPPLVAKVPALLRVSSQPSVPVAVLTGATPTSEYQDSYDYKPARPKTCPGYRH